MGVPQSPLQYPTEYFKILEQAATGRRITFNFQKESKSRYFQLRFGGFRKAVQRAVDNDPQMALLAMGVEIKRNGLSVTIGPIRAEPEVVAALEDTGNDNET